VVPLVRGVRRLPRILEAGEVEALMAALRTERDWAMVQAMLLVGLRGCEVLGLRLEDLRLGEWRVFIAEGKGGHKRLVLVSQAFFATVACYLNNERPADASTERGFVALKGPTRGDALSSEGLGEMFVNGGRKLTPWHRLNVDLRAGSVVTLRRRWAPSRGRGL
jgi:integrase/recombinase XerD